MNVFGGGSLLGTAWAIKKRRRRGAQAIRAFRQERLADLLRHAHEEVPLYRKRYGSSMPAVEAFSSLPVVTKAMVMESFSGSLAEPGHSLDELIAFGHSKDELGALYRDRYVFCHTSGTTGHRGYFLSRPESFRTAMLLNAMSHEAIWKRPGVILAAALGLMRLRVAFVVSTNGRFGDAFFARQLADEARLSLRLLDILAPPEEILDELNRFRPHLIHCYGGFGETLRQAGEAGVLCFSPSILSFSSEPISPSTLEGLERCLRPRRIVHTYAAAEAPHMARSCALGNMHVSEDHVILEAVDEAHRSVPPGTWSDHVLLTNLYNPFQPLLRYVLNDSIRIWDEPCPCGCPLPVVEIRGRSPNESLFEDGGGSPRPIARTGLYVTLLDVPDLASYQIVRRSPRSLFVRFVPNSPVLGPVVAEAICQALRRHLDRQGLGPAFEIEACPVDLLPPNPRSGKMDRFVEDPEVAPARRV